MDKGRTAENFMEELGFDSKGYFIIAKDDSIKTEENRKTAIANLERRGYKQGDCPNTLRAERNAGRRN